METLRQQLRDHCRELHRMAERELKRNASLTLSPTTLLHETYLNMRQRNPALFADPPQFMAYAARAMPRPAHRLHSQPPLPRSAAGAFRSRSSDPGSPRPQADMEIEKLGEALEELETTDPRLARLVDLRFLLRILLRGSPSFSGSPSEPRSTIGTRRAFICIESSRTRPSSSSVLSCKQRPCDEGIARVICLVDR